MVLRPRPAANQRRSKRGAAYGYHRRACGVDYRNFHLDTAAARRRGACGAVILAGDIGATNARFGCYRGGARVAWESLETQDYDSADALLAAAVARLPRPEPHLDACCLAVAGPVMAGPEDETAHLTNASLVFSRRRIGQTLGVPTARLVNDMVAIGAALDTLAPAQLRTLAAGGAQGGEPGAAKGILAAGTGLGMGVVVGDRCLPSEGGHARIAPAGAFERELVAVTEAELKDEGGVVAWEHYLSGRGVERLHRAVRAVWGEAGAALSATEITRRGLAGADPVCDTTVRTWVGMLASAAGGLATTAMTLGGVYFTGSVTLSLAPLLGEPLFARRFREAAWAADFLADIPLHLVTDSCAGLDGAARLAARGRDQRAAPGA